MTHERPSGTGWISGTDSLPVEVASEPAGDGVGPDHQAPDIIPGQDPKEAKRLQRDYREALKAAEQGAPDPGTPELYESAEEPRTPNPFPVREPGETRAERPEDPREGQRSR